MVSIDFSILNVLKKYSFKFSSFFFLAFFVLVFWQLLLQNKHLYFIKIIFEVCAFKKAVAISFVSFTFCIIVSIFTSNSMNSFSKIFSKIWLWACYKFCTISKFYFIRYSFCDFISFFRVFGRHYNITKIFIFTCVLCDSSLFFVAKEWRQFRK